MQKTAIEASARRNEMESVTAKFSVNSDFLIQIPEHRTWCFCAVCNIGKCPSLSQLQVEKVILPSRVLSI